MGLFVLMRWLALQPFLDATWRVEANDVVELVSSPLPQLKGLNGRHLERISGSEGHTVDVDARLLHRSPRWSVDDATRRHQLDAQQRLSRHAGPGRGHAAFFVAASGWFWNPAHAAWRVSEPCSGCWVPSPWCWAW